MEIAVIVNPISGGGKVVRNLKLIEDSFRKSGATTQIVLTKEKGHAYELALSLSGEAGLDAVVAAGGDGTVNETAHGLVGSSTPLGILPVGSGNGLARQLGMSLNVPEACRMIAQGQVSTIDSGLNNGQPFFVTTGLGFDGLVAHQFAMSKRRGLGSYIAAVLQLLRKWQPFEAKVEVWNGPDYTKTEGPFSVIVAANAEQYGNNAYIAPGAELNDELLNLTAVGNVDMLQLSSLGPSLFNKTLTNHKAVWAKAGSRFRVETAEPQYYHLDGEPSGIASSFDISVLPASLKVIIS